MHRSNPLSLRTRQEFPAGAFIYASQTEGLAWRVVQGAVRLDWPDAAGESGFASLAIAGDIIGSEAMLFGTYAFAAHALTPCVLLPWPEGAARADGASLLEGLAAAQRRAADVVALRGGQALARIVALIRLLSAERGASGQVVLPTRQDVAEITSLRIETVSRVIKMLERAGVLAPVRQSGVPVNRSFQFNFAHLDSDLAYWP